MKIIYVIGEPGTGKTTLMKRVFEYLNFSKTPRIQEQFPLVPYHVSESLGIFMLGKYEDGEVFAGTDRMSMAVQPWAIKFLEDIEKENDDLVIIGEGDRLSTPTFIEHIVDKYDAIIYYIRASEEIKKARYKERGSNQSDIWLQGRVTKLNNIVSMFNMVNGNLHNLKKFDNNNLEDQEKIYQSLIQDLV